MSDSRDNLTTDELRNLALARLGVVAFCFGALACPRTQTGPVLKLNYQHQSLNLCVPTSASMILDYYGDPHTPQELKSLATPPGSTFPGTYMKDMVSGVAKLGYVWETRCFAVDNAGFEAGLPELKRSIVEGRPVMVGLYDPPVGHVVVLIGFDESGHRLAFLDPNEPFPGRRSMTEGAFHRVWRENIVDLRCAILTRPRSMP